ncbi:MAG: ABC transporter substrate-binding protein [Azospirillum sp.]|nr:ABC transporter substrate-binding protein [Azospirillum sp.]
MSRIVSVGAMGLALLGFAGAALGGSALAGEKVTFATDWLAQAEQGGFYQALAAGIYARHGLDVDLKPGGPMVNVQQGIAAGLYDFAMGSNGFFVPNLVRAGAPVRAVMASFQKDPQILMCHPRPDIRGLADMAGKPVLLARDSLTTFWPWLKAKFGFTDQQIRPYTFNLTPFLVNPETIQQGYLGSEPYSAQTEGGITPQVYLLADAGYPSYGAMVMVQQTLIDTRPALVQAFVDATIEGWYDYLYGDPSAGNALIKKTNPDMTDALITYGLAQMKEHGVVDSGDALELGVGAMTDARWRFFLETMAREGLYPADLDVTKGYTLQFVNRRHAIEMRRP